MVIQRPALVALGSLLLEDHFTVKHLAELLELFIADDLLRKICKTAFLEGCGWRVEGMGRGVQEVVWEGNELGGRRRRRLCEVAEERARLGGAGLRVAWVEVGHLLEKLNSF